MATSENRQPVGELVKKWVDLWATDPREMVRQVYARDVLLESMAISMPSVKGADELLLLEEQLLSLIPDHKNHVNRIISDGQRAVIESFVTGHSPGDHKLKSTSVCVWWWINEQNLVSREIGHFDWERGRRHDEGIRGWVPENDGKDRGRDWYREKATQLAHLWSRDPVRMAKEMYAPDCIVEQMGSGREGVMRGLPQLCLAEKALLKILPRPWRSMEIHEVVGEGSAVGILFSISGVTSGEGPRMASRGTVVLSFDPAGLIISDRVYWDWGYAEPVPFP